MGSRKKIYLFTLATLLVLQGCGMVGAPVHPERTAETFPGSYPPEEDDYPF